MKRRRTRRMSARIREDDYRDIHSIEICTAIIVFAIIMFWLGFSVAAVMFYFS